AGSRVQNRQAATAAAIVAADAVADLAAGAEAAVRRRVAGQMARTGVGRRRVAAAADPTESRGQRGVATTSAGRPEVVDTFAAGIARRRIAGGVGRCCARGGA